MEYGWNFTIFCLKMMVTSGPEKIFLKFLHKRRNFFSNKNDLLSAKTSFCNYQETASMMVLKDKLLACNKYKAMMWPNLKIKESSPALHFRPRVQIRPVWLCDTYFSNFLCQQKKDYFSCVKLKCLISYPVKRIF